LVKEEAEATDVVEFHWGFHLLHATGMDRGKGRAETGLNPRETGGRSASCDFWQVSQNCTSGGARWRRLLHSKLNAFSSRGGKKVFVAWKREEDRAYLFGRELETVRSFNLKKRMNYRPRCSRRLVGSEEKQKAVTAITAAGIVETEIGKK